MATFFITFGMRFHHDEHTVLGRIPDLPERHVEVVADDEVQARTILFRDLGSEWAFLYDQESWSDLQTRHPSKGCAATLTLGEPYVNLDKPLGAW